MYRQLKMSTVLGPTVASESLSLKQLKNMAKQLKIQNYWKLKKAECITAINDYVHPLLYIYAKGNVSTSPVNDELTEELEKVLDSCTVSGAYCNGFFDSSSGFLGVHICVCGEQSESRDYLLTPHYATNTLAVHYLRYHREEVPESELEKVRHMLEEHVNEGAALG